MECRIVITIIGILAAFVVPSFGRVSERSHVDAAARYVRSIWSAQRVYWLENRTFTTSLDDLLAMKLIDAKLSASGDGYFAYTVSNVTSDTFTVQAFRFGSGTWTGTLTITEDGEVIGFVSGSGTVLIPLDI